MYQLNLNGGTNRRSKFFNELDEVDRRNEYAQTTIGNFSDHYAGALELKMKIGLSLVMVTQKWPNKLYQIQERLLRLGEPGTVEANSIPELVIEPEEGRLETQRGEVPEAAVMVDRWRSVNRSAMEVKIKLKATASTIEGSKRSLKSKCGEKEFNQTIELYKTAGWIEEDELSVAGEAPVATAEQLRKEEALVEDAR